MAMVFYSIGGVILMTYIVIVWCLTPLYLRMMDLSASLTNLALAGEDWYGEAEQLDYYRRQSTWGLIRFCIAEKSRAFDDEKMMDSKYLLE